MAETLRKSESGDPHRAIRGDSVPEVGRLAFSRIRPHLQASRSGFLRAPNPFLLLGVPQVDLGTLADGAPIEIDSEVEILVRKLSAGLRRSAASSQTRRAVAAEVGHLARLTASLATQRRVGVRIGGMGDAALFDDSSDDVDRVVVAQILRPEARLSGSEPYRRALANPRDTHGACQGEAWIAWGRSREALGAVRSRLGRASRASSTTGEELVVVLSAKRDAPQALVQRQEPRFPAVVSRRDGDPIPVVLVSAPFSPLDYPSLGLSTLKETVAEPPPVVYLTIPFAESVGLSFYDWIASGQPAHKYLLGEWIFGRVLGRDRGPDEYLEAVLCAKTLAWLDSGDDDESVELVPLAAVTEVAEMINAGSECIRIWAREIAALEPRIVGFTSLFQQNAASLALAKRLKERSPDIVTVFGGANWEAEMGAALHRSYRFVDVAVSGEAELVFPRLIGALLSGDRDLDMPGVRVRRSLAGSDSTSAGNAPKADIDSIPRPDFTDFFDQWRQSPIAGSIRPSVLFETSRGCWWGAKSHCTFCGLNGASMAFRSKSSERVLDEMKWLSREYSGYDIAAVDNILDMTYFSTVLAELETLRLPLSLFYEVKANLTRRQVAQLKRAGVDHIQPGIESFSDHILKLMAKGVTGLQNIQLLKWCAEYQIVPHWNLLWGFPGETEDDYLQMSRDIRLITHLTPPVGMGALRLDRFSPNHTNPDRFGFADVRPADAYRFVYDGLPSDRLAEIAYYFDYGYVNQRSPGLSSAVRGVVRDVELWRLEHESSRLVHFVTDEGLLVFDGRACATEAVHLLRKDEKRALELCDRVQSVAALEKALGKAATSDAVERLTSRRLMMRVGEKLLTLSLCGQPPLAPGGGA